MLGTHRFARRDKPPCCRDKNRGACATTRCLAQRWPLKVDVDAYLLANDGCVRLEHHVIQSCDLSKDTVMRILSKVSRPIPMLSAGCLP